jgi:prepilin peptidase CpaA
MGTGVLNHGIIFNLFLVLFTALAVGFDIAQRRIPNWLNFAGMAGGLFFSASLGASQIYVSLLGLIAGVGLQLIPFYFGWIGAGDVKLFGAIGAIFGLSWIPRLFVYSALIGGLVALISLASTEEFRYRLFKRKLMIPYGVAIGLAGLVAFYLDPQGTWAGF